MEEADQMTDRIGRRKQKLSKTRREMTEQESLGAVGIERCNQLRSQAVALEDQGDHEAGFALRCQEESLLRDLKAMTFLAGCLIIKARLLAGPLARPQEAQAVLLEAEQLFAQHDLKEHGQDLRAARRFVEGALVMPMPEPLTLEDSTESDATQSAPDSTDASAATPSDKPASGFTGLFARLRGKSK